MFFQHADPARGIALDHEFLVIGVRIAVHLSVAEHVVDGAQQLVGGGQPTLPDMTRQKPSPIAQGFFVAKLLCKALDIASSRTDKA